MNMMQKKDYLQKEIVNYLIVGILTTVVSLGVYFGCKFVFCDSQNAVQLQVSNIVSWIAAVTFAYYANRKYVFKSKDKNVLKEMIIFYESRLVTLFADMVCMFVMVTIIGINDIIAKAVVQVIVTVGNYVSSKILVFKEKST